MILGYLLLTCVPLLISHMMMISSYPADTRILATDLCTSADIPYDDDMLVSSCYQDILCCRMPFYHPNPSSKNNIYIKYKIKYSELGTRQFLASRRRQPDNVSKLQRQAKIRKILRLWYLNRVAPS